MNNKWPHGGNVFQQTGTIFVLVKDIIGSNLLTKFHEDPTINVAYTTIDKRFIPSYPENKFHEDWTKNVTSRVFTYINETNVLTKNFDFLSPYNTSPPPGGHVFQGTGTIFELNQHII
ncbi:hypothetical protein DPMN_083791 [Dreissena polymorpha]|uniref:Uncharacterized protein n=1 Tax=Dreissena polymorpha TaxID=45954 RepID=A0A9D3Y9F6_DREPO|nr:hypothetical protein DPMN_083791 [Dreissena polymorpha]